MKTLLLVLIAYAMMFVYPLDQWKMNGKEKNTDMVKNLRREYGVKNPECKIVLLYLQEGLLNQYIIFRCIKVPDTWFEPIFLPREEPKKETL